MDEVVEALEKYHGLVPLVYDIETMSLDEARSEDMPYAVYLKRNADRVIARHKYKRCLAMAERCKFRMYYLSTVVDYELSKLIPNPTAVKRYTKKESRMDYWKKRWLELAERFK